MRHTLTLFLIFLLFIKPVSAQDYNQKIPEYGKVSKEDLLIKECSFDKDAEAYKMFEVGEMYCSFFPTASNPVETEFEHHVRIKIINTKGLKHADIRIPYLSRQGVQEIKSLTAQTYNLDAAGNISIVKVEKGVIYEKKLDARYSEKVFTFPDVKAGSIIEYKYKIKGSGLRNWYFQKSIPVQLSRAIIDFPVEFQVQSIPYCSLPYDRKDDDKGNRSIQKYTMLNVPALRDEPYISCDEDYLQRLEPELVAINIPGQQRYPLTTTWPRIIRGLMEDEDFGLQLKREIPRTADLDAALAQQKTDIDKMKTIYYYVRKNMEWNNYDNIWALDGVKAAWKDKKGTSGEINLILVNLLRDAGINAHPVLVSTRENGRVKTLNADLSQFDRVMAYVQVGGKKYVMDATDKYTPYNIIPASVSFSEGLVISKPLTFEWGWEALWEQKQIYRNMAFVIAEIGKDDNIKGSATVSSSGYSRLDRIADLKAGKEKFVEKYFREPNPGVKIDSVAIENEDADTLELKQQFDFSMPLSTSGDYKYFRLNMFSGFEKNVFVADTRSSDIFFGANQLYTVVGNYTIPENYEFDELPKSMKMIMPDTSIILTRVVSAKDTELSVRFTVEFRLPFYPVDSYPDFQEFYKQLFDLLNEQIIIKKKANP